MVSYRNHLLLRIAVEDRCHRSKQSGRERGGFTLLELVVAIAVIGLLAALLIPAVQQTRATARGVVCRNNLKQFAVAISSHAEAHGTYPTSQRPESAYWRLLPYFERTDLLEAIHRFQSPGGDAPGSWHVESFGCPDDSVVWEQMVAGSTNYYYNCGTRFLTRTPYNGFQKSTQQDTRPSDISDGLSQTVAMSERLVRRLTLPWPPPEVFEREPRRSSWWTEVRYGGAGEEALAIDQCRNHRTTTFPPIGGKSAFNLQSGNGYDHLLPPNHPACNNGPEDFGFDGELMLIPSSSNHSGGAFSLLADGSVHFVSELVDPEVWQALGTRNGQEGVALPF